MWITSSWSIWLKGLSKSLSAALCTGSVHSLWLSFVIVMVSITSFITMSCDLGTLDGVSDFFCKVYFLPILPRKHFIVLTLTKMSSLAWICCDAWNDLVTLGNWSHYDYLDKTYVNCQLSCSFGTWYWGDFIFFASTLETWSTILKHSPGPVVDFTSLITGVFWGIKKSLLE